MVARARARGRGRAARREARGRRRPLAVQPKPRQPQPPRYACDAISERASPWQYGYTASFASSRHACVSAHSAPCITWPPAFGTWIMCSTVVALNCAGSGTGALMPSAIATSAKRAMDLKIMQNRCAAARSSESSSWSTYTSIVASACCSLYAPHYKAFRTFQGLATNRTTSPFSRTRAPRWKLHAHVAIVHHSACEGHVVPGHPECPGRVRAILDALAASGAARPMYEAAARGRRHAPVSPHAAARAADPQAVRSG